MSKGNAGGMLGGGGPPAPFRRGGGTRNKLSRGALRGGKGTGHGGQERAERARRDELLRKFQERSRKE
ncbi:DUF6243 family protein [Streptomyces tubercidicus]|uniref:Uncharacterized protein n=1 Tax=Streptomyces tubercidicus TaxID=47759 RepID=A0A640UY22_9ACTN|nr:DUF6243 family protein [Streptomyces tubercidicus]WAU14499.1 DUF6243 family protein [Streptomyces tubercidicus]GFE40242.1 hypothetical protein Stube_49150 [Streptomyces tubercidicus]